MFASQVHAQDFSCLSEATERTGRNEDQSPRQPRACVGHHIANSPVRIVKVKVLRVNLTRKQIEDSPSIESHKPVSRQFEEQYHRYYGWPYYWQGDALWGMSGVPMLELPPIPAASATSPKPKQPDAHLRSTQAVNGYHLQASDGMIGHVCDFMMDDESWGIGQLVVKTGHRLSGKEVQIPAIKVDRISYEDSTVFVNLTREDVEQSPAHYMAAMAEVV